MIEAECPYCGNKIMVVDDVAVYNLNRIGETLYSCDCCKKTMRIYNDGGTIRTLRIMKKEVKYVYKDL